LEKENGTPNRRNVTFAEDAGRTTKGKDAAVAATLASAAI
jgi:hypothetical protein